MSGLDIYLKKCKTMILILVATFVVFGFLISKIVPMVTEIFNINNEYTTAQTSIADKKRTLENLKKKAEETAKTEKNQVKAFYKPIEQGLDTESAIASEFAEILTLVRNNAIKTRSIKYEYNPQDDNFVKNLPDKYDVAKLDTEMIGTYMNFESFLKELYKHEHLVDISSIEIVPYQKDKKILIIKFQLKLYAQK